MASFEDYDEFGNYIGADIDSEEEADVEHDGIPASHLQQQQPLEGYDEPVGADPGTALMDIDGGCQSCPKHVISQICCTEPTHKAVILHEDKQYYPSASDVYGEGVETLVQEEDAQPLTEPIIAPVKVRKWAIEEKDMPETRFDKGYVLRCNVRSASHERGVASS
jgi:U5 small nuclear ribonucleoprotein component